MYYLAPSLLSTHKIADDLKALGIAEWFVHVISKDEAGLKKEQLHSADRHFINPFSRVQRKKQARQVDQAYE